MEPKGNYLSAMLLMWAEVLEVIKSDKDIDLKD